MNREQSTQKIETEVSSEDGRGVMDPDLKDFSLTTGSQRQSPINRNTRHVSQATSPKIDSPDIMERFNDNPVFFKPQPTGQVSLTVKRSRKSIISKIGGVNSQRHF